MTDESVELRQRYLGISGGRWHAAKMTRLTALAVAALLLAACDESPGDEAEAPPPVRGLITVEVAAPEETTVRRYPGVLEPGEITPLSFEVAGKLGRVSLTVGQRVAERDVLARLDREQFEIEIQNKTAAVEEIQATLKQAEEDLERSETLLTRGVVTQVRRDQDRTTVLETRAQLVQTQKDLDSAKEDLTETILYAPFDGIINSVDADSFETVSAGTTVTSLYSASAYEVSFSVNFDVVSRLVVGTPGGVRLADDPTVVLDAVVSELGERADTVSSFPVVVQLREDHPLIKAGMAVQVSFEFQLPAAQGFPIPLSAAIAEGQIPPDSGPGKTVPLQVYVYDAESSTVKRRDVKMAGIRGNKFLVIEGLDPGELVASAGVSFLREGMQVKLIEPSE
ncbi:MAG: efflux RND transporter periplasmic adaptor subunit [Pseudomonadota bacterium]